MQPLLTWVGSKRWQVEMLRPVIFDAQVQGCRIVELFAGSAALSFGVEAAEAHLNDANPHLINFYRQYVSGDILDFSGVTSEKEYYSRRDWFNRMVREGRGASPTAAGLFYYLNHTAFNNLWRVNGDGEMNAPFRKGRESCAALTAGLIPPGWTFSNEDFRDVLLRPDDFVYADPPYLGTFDGYTADGFWEGDFTDLVTLLMNHPGRVVISNSAHPVAMRVCQQSGLHVKIVESGQKMQASRGRKDQIPEMLASNFPLT